MRGSSTPSRSRQRPPGSHVKVAANKASKAVSVETAKPQKPKHRGLLIFGIIAAAVAAGAAAWKASQPVEDPWKTPAPVTPAPVPATTVNEVKDAAGRCRQGWRRRGCRSGRCCARLRRSHRSAADAADKAKHAAEDAAEDIKDASAKVATDAKTAVRNIAASLNNGADKNAGN